MLSVRVIVVVLACSWCASACTYLARYAIWQKSDVDDYRRFPKEEVPKAKEAFTFKAATQTWPIGETRVRWDRAPVDFERLMTSSGTTAFLVVRNDTLLYEGYFNGYGRASTNTSFSIAKSVTSLLVGIASGEGYVRPDDLLVKHLPELKNDDARFNRLTLDHLLDMRSGITFRDNDLPTGDRVRAYYSPRLRERLTHLTMYAEPGEEFRYNTYNPQLIGLVLEKVTGRSPAALLAEKIWDPLGMEYDASWSLDSERGKMVKMESGINATAIDFAKIGRLVLRNGEYGGVQVVPAAWIARLKHHDSSNQYPGDKLVHYESFWWSLKPFQQYRHCIYADGHLGQFIFIFPEENMVIVRMGKRMGEETPSVFNWLVVCSDIIRQLEAGV